MESPLLPLLVARIGEQWKQDVMHTLLTIKDDTDQ
jgi:hypothetical protein